jgi:hypothetical protein
VNFDQSGPVMLCATKVLKPGPARVGKIAGNIALPRTVEVPVLLAGGGGFIAGVLFAAVFLGSFVSVMVSGMVGAGLGWVAVTYSPLKGESLGKWAGLEVASRVRRVKVDGQRVRVYVGVCAVTDVPRGYIRVVGGAVNVAAGSVDDRGRFVDLSDEPVVLVPPPQPSPQRWSPGPQRTEGFRPPTTVGPTLFSGTTPPSGVSR